MAGGFFRTVRITGAVSPATRCSLRAASFGSFLPGQVEPQKVGSVGSENHFLTDFWLIWGSKLNLCCAKFSRDCILIIV